MNSIIPIKLQRTENHVRRFRLEDVIENSENKDPYAVLNDFVKTSFPELSNFSLKYEDDEDDMITISSKQELEEAFNVARELKRKTLRLFINEESDKTEEKEIPVVIVELQYDGQVKDLELPQDSLNYTTITNVIISLFPELDNCLTLKYKDDEDDLVTVKQDHEITEAFELFNNEDMGDKLVFVAEKQK